MGTPPEHEGTTSNRYTIIGRLAGGGMADIYIAKVSTEGGVERHVVLKRVLDTRSRDQTFARMFLDEARLAAQLQHPNIAQVHDVGKLAGSYFFTMEYVHGEDVRAVMYRLATLRRPLPIPHALYIAVGALSALHHAHERKGPDGVTLGVVHRDVSPSNMMVAYDGTVKLLDFGVAKATQRTAESHAGTIKGKIAYLSPEQCEGKDVDRRSDIFSLGIVLFEMLTGRRLYKRDSDFKAMTAIVSEHPPMPSSRRPELSPALDAIVLKALAKNPAARYATAADMLEAIEAAAAADRHPLSATSMGRFMRELFGERKEPWIELPVRDQPDSLTVTGKSLTTGDVLPTQSRLEPDAEFAAQLASAPTLGRPALAEASPSPVPGVTPVAGVPVKEMQTPPVGIPVQEPSRPSPAVSTLKPTPEAVTKASSNADAVGKFDVPTKVEGPAKPEAAPAAPAKPEPGNAAVAKSEPAKPEPAKPEPATAAKTATPATPEPATSAQANKSAAPGTVALPPIAPAPTRPAKPSTPPTITQAWDIPELPEDSKVGASALPAAAAAPTTPASPVAIATAKQSFDIPAIAPKTSVDEKPYKGTAPFPSLTRPPAAKHPPPEDEGPSERPSARRLATELGHPGDARMPAKRRANTEDIDTIQPPVKETGAGRAASEPGAPPSRTTGSAKAIEAPPGKSTGPVKAIEAPPGKSTGPVKVVQIPPAKTTGSGRAVSEPGAAKARQTGPAKVIDDDVQSLIDTQPDLGARAGTPLAEVLKSIDQELVERGKTEIDAPRAEDEANADRDRDGTADEDENRPEERRVTVIDTSSGAYARPDSKAIDRSSGAFDVIETAEAQARRRLLFAGGAVLVVLAVVVGIIVGKGTKRARRGNATAQVVKDAGTVPAQDAAIVAVVVDAQASNRFAVADAGFIPTVAGDAGARAAIEDGSGSGESAERDASVAAGTRDASGVDPTLVRDAGVASRDASAPSMTRDASVASLGRDASVASLGRDASVSSASGDASVFSPRDPTPTVATLSIAELEVAGDFAAVLVACGKQKKLSASDLAACTRSACNLKKRSVALKYAKRIPKADLPEVDRACKAHGISLGVKQPEPKVDPCETNPLKCQK